MFISICRAAGAICVGLGVGLVIGFAAPSWSQSGVPGDALLAGLEARIASLQIEVTALANRVEDAEDAESKPRTAPFTVANKAGQPIFSISEEGVGADVRILGSAGVIILKATDEARISLSTGNSRSVISASGEGPRLALENAGGTLVAGPSGGDMKLSLTKGQTSVELLARDGAPLLAARNGVKSASLGQVGAAFGFRLESGGNPQASLSDPGDGKVSMRIWPTGGGGGPVVQAGHHTDGKPGVSIWEGANPVVRMDGNGTAGQVRLFQDGQPMALLGNIDADTAGLLVFEGSDQLFATVSKGDGPELTLFRQGTHIFKVNGAGGNPLLQLGREGEGTWKLGASSDHIELAGRRKDAVVGMGDVFGSKGFAVAFGKDQRSFFGVQDDGHSGMHLWEAGTSLPVLSAGRGKNGQPAFRVREAGGKDVAVLTTKDGTQGELSLFDAAGEFAKVGARNGSGALVLSQSGKPTLTLGPTEEKQLPAFRAYEGGKMVFAAGASPVGTGVVVAYGGDSIGASLEGSPQGGGSISVMSNGAEVASINSTDNSGKGVVVVRAPSGVPLASLGSGSSGGGNVTAMDPAGSGVFSAGYTGGDGPGSACVLQKGMKCLGVGLTGMEGFR